MRYFISRQNGISIATLLEINPWSTGQKVAAVLAAGAITLDGLDIQILSFAVPAIAREWHLAKSSFALVFALSLLAVAAGTFVGGFLGDRFGRRRAILLAVLWFGVSTLLLASSDSLSTLFLWRLVSGLGIGAALPNAAAFISEITPTRARTTTLSATIVCIPFGGVVGGLLAAHVLPIASWRVLIVIGGMLPILLSALLYFFLPESPRFLATRANGRPELFRILTRFGIHSEQDTIFAEDTVLEPSDNISALVRPPYRRDTFSLWSAFCFCLISIYFVFNWLPSMLSSLGLDSAASSRGLADYNLGGILGSVLLGLWINRMGSRVPVLIAAGGAILTALWLSMHLVTPASGSSLLSFQLGLHGFFTNAVQTALYALAANLYATRFRSRGVAAASAFGRTGAILSAFLGGEALHHSGSIYFSILCCSLTCVLVSLLFLRNHIRPGGAELV